MNAFDRGMEELERQYADGEITLAEFTKLVSELERDAREELRERAQDAYDNVMNEGF